MALIAIFLATLLPTLAAAGGSVSADLALIKRLGPDAYQDERLDAPFISLFERDDKRLIFIAGDHGEGIGSAVAKTIRHAFKRYKPQGVVVEGLSAGDDVGAADRLSQAQRFARDWPEELPENYYPIYLAQRHKLTFVGGEPSLDEKAGALKSLGYSAEDLLGLMVAANVGALRKDCARDRTMCAKMHDGMARDLARQLGLSKDYGFGDFEKWFARRAHLKKPAHQINHMDCRPVAPSEANFLQTIAYHLELVREGRIVRQIEMMLNRHDRVLVVYGGGHLVRQREVWRQALGPSKDYKPF